MDKLLSDSRRVNLFLGQYRVAIEIMTPSELVDLLQRCLRVYLDLDVYPKPGFEPAYRYSVWEKGSHIFFIELPRVQFQGLKPNALLLPLTRFDSQEGFEKVEGMDQYVTREDHLLLHIDGRLVQWHQATTIAFPGDRPLVMESAFSIMDWEVLEGKISYGVVVNAIDKLRGTVEQYSRGAGELFRTAWLLDLVQKRIGWATEGIGGEMLDFAKLSE